MADYYYKISVNGTESDESDDYDSISERWSNLANVLEGRGGHAVLYRRSVHDKSILRLLADSSLWMVVDDLAISPYEVFAEINAG